MFAYLASLDELAELPAGVDLVHEFPPTGDDTTAPLFTVGSSERRPARVECHCGAYGGREHYGTRLYLDQDGCLRIPAGRSTLAHLPSTFGSPPDTGCDVDAVDAGWFDGPDVEFVPEHAPPAPADVERIRTTGIVDGYRDRPVARPRTRTGRQLNGPTIRPTSARRNAPSAARPGNRSGRQLSKGARP